MSLIKSRHGNNSKLLYVHVVYFCTHYRSLGRLHSVEADQPLPRDGASEAVQVVTPQLKHRDDAAGQADLVDSVHGPAGQAAGHDAVEPPQPHIVHDQVCNDLDYLKLLMEAQSEENKASNDRRRKEHEEDLANFSKMIKKSCQF